MSVQIVEGKKRSHFGGVFWTAQAALISSAIVHPLDTMKVHCQLKAEGHHGAAPRSLIIARDITGEFGFHRLWAGVEPFFVSRANHIAMRLGIYKAIIDKEKAKDKYHSVPMWYKALAAGYAGGISGFANAPLDFLALRMQSDLLLPAAQRKNYGLLPVAVKQLYQEVGFFGLWRGSFPTTAKYIALNVGMLAPYDQFVEFAARQVGDLPGIKLVAAYYAAMVGCFLAQPFDNIKTKMQAQLPDAKGKLKYTSMNDCFVKTITREGVSGLYVGYWTHVTKVGPQAFIALKLLEYFNYYI